MEDEPLEQADRMQQALSLAYGYVDRRERTVGEVRRYLQLKGLDGTRIDEALGNLIALGVLDDARFARVFADDKRELEQWGADRIRRGLMSRGVERELIEGVLVEQAADSELGRALALLRRRFPARLRDRRDRNRALGVLIRKGYDSETSLEAIDRCAHAAADTLD